MDELAEAAAKPATWSARGRLGAGQLLARLLGPATRRAGWPPEERKAAERVELALDRLAVLDELEPTVDLDVFTRTLTVELESDLGRVGRLGEGVLVGSVSMGLGLELDLAVLCWAGRGLLPRARSATTRSCPTRSARPRAASSRCGADQIDRHHRELLATLAGAARQVLSVPRGDLRRSQRAGALPMGARRRGGARRRADVG